jgi:MFS family permease
LIAEALLAVPSLTVPRGLILICGCTAAWAFNFGLATQLTSLWLNDLGHSDTVIGLNQGLYYFGLAAVVLLVPRMMRRWSLRCTVAGLALSGISTILFPYAPSLAVCYVLRMLGGVAAAMTLIPLETFIGRDAPPEHRSRNFGCYAVALTLGGGVGIGLGPNFFASLAVWPFWLAGLTVLVAALAFVRYRPTPSAPLEQAAERPSLPPARVFLSYGTAWSQGFLEGGMLAFLSLYLLSLGLSKESTGLMLGASMVGILLFQVPVSWLGDLLGRTGVLLACYGVVAAGLWILPWLAPGMWLVVWLFLLGGCSGSFYPLGMALLGNQDTEARVAKAYAWYMILESVGSQMGPPLMGMARDRWGEPAMFVIGEIAVMAVLCAWIAFPTRATRRDVVDTSDMPEPSTTAFLSGGRQPSEFAAAQGAHAPRSVDMP